MIFGWVSVYSYGHVETADSLDKVVKQYYHSQKEETLVRTHFGREPLFHLNYFDR